MAHHTPLIATIVVGLSLAFVFGALANRIRVSPIVGYLLAGIAVGPNTPGFVADQTLANELAEIGVILLMFGVGLHFSLKDLWSVRAIAIPGAIAQITVATLLGYALASYLGWSTGAGIVFGFALSTASTVVLLRTVQERRLLNSDRGRIAVGWLIVEDIACVFALVLLPALAPLLSSGPQSALASGMGGVLTTLAITMAKVAAFVGLMMLLGRRFIPWLMHYIARTGSRELFRLGVLVVALGFAFGAARLFGVSFALGAFFAGVILSESELSQRAAQETLPLRDAFAVLFFVSVGMLFEPTILVRELWPLLATLVIILIGKSLAALAIVLAFGRPLATALTISASLAQIGEFSFILAGLGVGLGLMPTAGRDLILAGALLSIMANPLLFVALDSFLSALDKWGATPAPDPGITSHAGHRDVLQITTQRGHVALVGYGRVGHRVGEALHRQGTPLLVIDESDKVVEKLVGLGIDARSGDAQTMLEVANLAEAKGLIVAIPDPFEAGQIVTQARRANPALAIIARAHSDEHAVYLRDCGASTVVVGAEEIAGAMVRAFAAGRAA